MKERNTILLNPEDYYTQRNNKYYPAGSCMNTSRAMFYKAAGIHYVNSSGLSDDDYFYLLLNSDEAKEFRDKKYPNMKNVPPNEIHGMYGSYLDEKVTGKRRTDFKTDLSWYAVVSELLRKRPVMTSGRFEGIDGHAFVFIGYDEDSDELVAADPWGNPHQGYSGRSGAKGYGIRYNKSYFNEHVKPGLNKWGHVLI